jgi:hypothetical protein
MVYIPDWKKRNNAFIAANSYPKILVSGKNSNAIFSTKITAK